MNSDGIIVKDGAPYYGIGVNYMDAFTRCLKDPEDTSYEDGFAALAAHGIPFVRLNFGGFYPVAWALYQEEPAKYFALMDRVVQSAEAHGIGLIPSLFWWSACIPDLVGEPRNRWGDPTSKTHAFMKQYVKDVVSRYKDTPAIWAWEFGNEYNLAVDLPNAESHRPQTPVVFGCPAERGPEDDLNSAQVLVALTAFGDAIREIDSHRPISTGHSVARSSARHLRLSGTWEQDNREEFRGNLAFMTPAPLDMISVHVYPHAAEKRFGEAHVGYAALFAEACAAAQGAKKGLFVGEFGPPPDNEAPWTQASAQAEGEALVAALLKSPVQLAAFWVFDFPWQEASMSVSTTNHRRGYLDVLKKANHQLAER